MKLYQRIKTKPEDFVVEEVPAIEIGNEGKFNVYVLKKSNVSTIEAIRLIAKFTKIPLKEIGFAGLKDKFAVTTQYLTIPESYNLEDFCVKLTEKGWTKAENLQHGNETGFCVKRIGKSKIPLSIGDLKGNKFTVVIRNLEKELRERFYKNLEIVKNFGMPNYFGEQRFGSVKGRDDFVMRYILKGDYEGALKSYFLGKGNIEFWGDWRKLYRTLSPKLEEYEKDLIKGLMRGLSPEKAFRILPKNVRLMFNFAFQSFLWNEYLREYIEEKYLFKRIRFINDWKLSFFLDVYDPDYLSQLEIPFTAHEHHPQDYLLRKVISKVQRRYGIRREWFDKEVAGIKVMTDGLRKAVVSPQNFKIVEKTKEKITVKFYLPAGSYATILLRFLLKV